MITELLGQHGQDNLIGMLCYQIATISKQKYEAVFKMSDLDFNSEQAWILTKAQEDLEGGVHQSELVTEHNLIGGKSQVSRLIHDLVEKKYIVRRADKVDRRQIYLVITAEGLDKFNVVQEVINVRKAAYLRTLSIDEYNTLLILLEKALIGVKNY